MLSSQLGPARLCIALIVAALLTSCAMGTNFVRPQQGQLVLGETTYDSITSTYGKPWSSGNASINGHDLKAVTYAYAQLGAAGHVDNIEPARGIFLWFGENKLVGQEFRSSFESDHTDFDEELRHQIEEGRTSEAAVLRIFGPPSGQYIYPMIEQEHGRAIVYSYTQTNPWASGGPKTLEKRLVLQLDEDGVVSKLDYVMGESEQ